MKKLFLLTALMLGIASCQSEPKDLNVVVGGEMDAVVHVSLPESTRAASSKGFDFTTLDGSGYDLRFILEITYGDTVVRRVETAKTTTMTFPVRLIAGRDYTFTVWADLVTTGTKTDLFYNTANGLDEIEVIVDEWTPNVEARDAYTFTKTVEDFTSTADLSMTLTRPFAKVRVVATDIDDIKEFDIEPVKAKINYLTKMYTGFNAVEGKVVEDKKESISHEFFYDEVDTYSDNTGELTIFADYILVPTKENTQQTITFNLETFQDRMATNSIKFNNFITPIVVETNKVTSIVGGVLTEGGNVSITIDGGLDEKHKYTFISSGAKLIKAMNTGGKYVLGNDVEVTNSDLTPGLLAATRTTGKESVINLNGYTITVKNTGSDALITITEGDSLTFAGEGGIVLDEQSAGAFIANEGTLNIEGGNVSAENNVNNKSVIENNGEANISGGELGDGALANNGEANISGGTINEGAVENNGEGTTVITGGEFTYTPEEDEIPEGYEARKDENSNTTTIVVSDPVAMIGDVAYNTLSAAFEAVENDQTITLCADVVAKNTAILAADKTATIDLNGFAISHFDIENKYAFNNHGTLTIKDSKGNGSINARGIYNGYGDGANIATAKLIVEGGSINAMGTNGGAAIYNYGIVEIKAGKFKSNGGYALNNQAGGSLTITDGEITGGIYNCGTLSIDGENTSVYQHISGRHAIYNWCATATINNGAFDSESGNELILADGQDSSVTINGGTFDKTAKSWLMGAATGKNITFVVNGGTFRGYVNMPEKTVDTFRPYNDPIVVRGGTFNFDPAKWMSDDYTATKDAENNTWTVTRKPAVAKIDNVEYTTLIKAVAAVKDGDTITLVADEVFTETNRSNNSGWWDGISYSGDKSFTIDLGDKTVSQNGALNDYLIWIKNVGSKANTITIKNGTLDAGTSAYCALCTASSHENQLTINLENINLINNKYDGSTVKVRGGSVVNVKAGTKITGENSYLGIENWNATVNVYEGAEIYMNGKSSYNGCLIGAGGNGVVNVYGGYGKGVSGGLIAMTSGGTINVSGGEWIANTDGTYANSNQSVLIAQSDKQYNAGAGNAVVNVTGGTFKGGYNCYGNAVGDAQINISGGNFNNNPSAYLVRGYEAVEENGAWSVGKPQALVDFETALANGGNVTLSADITLMEPVVIENKKVVIDLNGKTVNAPEFSAFEVTTGAELTIKNGKVVAYESTVRAIGGKVVIESGEYTSTGTALDSPATYRYSLDCREGGELIINGGTFKSNNGLINVSSTVTINGGKFENVVEKSMTRHFAYVSALLTINDGEFYGKANSSAGGCFFCGAGAGGDIQVKGGKFTSLWTSGSVNRIFEYYYGGTITVTGGMFNTNGGIATFVTENTDEATKAAYPYVAK